MKVKLVMAIPSLKKGGAERIFSFIANNIDKNIFQVYLIVFGNEEDIEFEIDQKNVTLIALNCKNVRSGVFRFLKTIRHIKPQIVVSTLTHLNIIFSFLSLFYGKRYQFVIREASVVTINNQREKFSFFFNLLLKFGYRNLNTIICQSNDMADDLIKNFKLSSDKVVVINNPITYPTPVLTNKTKKGTFTFISVGRLVASKGVDRILTIIARIDIPFKYIIVGDGPERQRLEEIAHKLNLTDKVNFAGQCDNLETFYREADLYLNGSFYEGFPNALIEACSFGIPIISFNIPGGINEIIKEEFNGIVVTDGDNDGFNMAIRRAKNMDWNNKGIQKDIYERFGQKQILKKYERIFLLNSK